MLILYTKYNQILRTLDNVTSANTCIHIHFAPKMRILCKIHCLTLYYTITTFNDPHTGSLLKTLWEKEKMLVTSIFSFSHNVFHPSQYKF